MAVGHIIFEEERKAMAEVVNLIYTRKLTNTAGGNFSFKTKDKDGKEYLIMTPTMMSEAYLGKISPSQVLVVEPHTRKIIAGEGNLTREINMHEAVYDTNPNINAVLHAHAPESMFWATSHLPMPNLTEATQKVKTIPVLEFAPNCSEELADTVSKHIKDNQLEMPIELLLDSHGVLIAVDAEDGITAIHKALSILDTVETNARIAYQQTVMQGMGILDGYYSKGVKVGDLEDIKQGNTIYNNKLKDLGGD